MSHPTRTKSFFRTNQDSPARKIFIPLFYISLAILYFYNLILRDVGSGVHIIRNNIDANATEASALVRSSSGSERSLTSLLEPRSLADVTIANAELAWKRRLDHENYLRRRMEARQVQMKKREEDAEHLRLATVQNEDDGTEKPYMNDTEEVTALMLSNSSSSNATEFGTDEYVKKLTSLASRRTPKRSNASTSQGGGEAGFVPVVVMVGTCTLFRLCVSVLIGRTADLDLPADSDEEGDGPNSAAAGRVGISSFMTGLSGGREAARLRRRARATRARRHFQRFVDRLNSEREANGERPIAADTLRNLVNSRDFNGNDYDSLSSFVEENGPAMGSIFSVIGATDAEIGRCPSRVLAVDDDLLRPRRVLLGGLQGHHQHQTCSVCLEPYQVGEIVRTVPCFHTFHAACIDPWLAQRAECPVCKHSAIG